MATMLKWVPVDIAPSQFKLALWQEKILREDQINHNWTRGLWRMNTIEEMSEFVVLWYLVQNITFTDRPDEIV